MELLKGPQHIFVYKVTPNSPAHRAFVRPNMVLLSINGEDVSRAKLTDAQQLLASAGDSVELYMRYDKEGQDKAVASASQQPTTPLSRRLEEEHARQQEDEEKERKQRREQEAEARRAAALQEEDGVRQKLETAADGSGDGSKTSSGHILGLVLALIIATLAVLFAVEAELPFST